MDYKIPDIEKSFEGKIVQNLGNNDYVIQINDNEHQLKIINMNSKGIEFILDQKYHKAKYLEQSTNEMNIVIDNVPITINRHSHFDEVVYKHSGGAGAGNAHLEMLIPVLEKSGFELGIDFKKVIAEADNVMEYLVPQAPVSTPVNVLTGLNKLFSGFEKPIIKASKLYGIEYSSLIFELGNRKLVAGQEDLILEVAQKLKK